MEFISHLSQAALGDKLSYLICRKHGSGCSGCTQARSNSLAFIWVHFTPLRLCTWIDMYRWVEEGVFGGWKGKVGQNRDSGKEEVLCHPSCPLGLVWNPRGGRSESWRNGLHEKLGEMVDPSIVALGCWEVDTQFWGEKYRTYCQLRGTRHGSSS